MLNMHIIPPPPPRGLGGLGWIRVIKLEHSPTTFHAAAIIVMYDNHVMFKLLISAWRNKMPPCIAIRTYLLARYPPPLAPPVARRIITCNSWANENSTAHVVAHCKTQTSQNQCKVLPKLCVCLLVPDFCLTQLHWILDMVCQHEIWCDTLIRVISMSGHATSSIIWHPL